LIDAGLAPILTSVVRFCLGEAIVLLDALLDCDELLDPNMLASSRGVRDVNVLLVGHIDRLRSRLDRSQYYRYEALARRPGVTLFGPGIEGYRPGMSVRAAVEVACAGIWPDVILHGMDFKESGVPLITELAEAPALTALELQDSWAVPEQQAAFINRERFDLGLLIVRHHIPYYQAHCPNTKFLWTPHAINTDLFKNYGVPKEYDVLLYGNIASHTYPLRARLARLLMNQSEFRFRFIPHPGYYPRGGPSSAPLITGETLSREINKAWITISTSSIYQCVMMKYYEIAASYSLIAGDMPEEGRLIFGNDFVELRHEQSDAELLASFREHLAAKGGILAATESAYRRITREYSTDAFADRLLDQFRGVLEARGREWAARPAATRGDARAPSAAGSAPGGHQALGPFTLHRASKGGLVLRRRPSR
jgi:hypothetical protein